MLDATLATVAARARAAAKRLARRKPSVRMALRRAACPELHEADELAEAQEVIAEALQRLVATVNAPCSELALEVELHREAGERARRAVQWALLARAMDGDAFAADALRAHAV